MWLLRPLTLNQLVKGGKEEEEEEVVWADGHGRPALLLYGGA